MAYSNETGLDPMPDHHHHRFPVLSLSQLSRQLLEIVAVCCSSQIMLEIVTIWRLLYACCCYSLSISLAEIRLHIVVAIAVLILFHHAAELSCTLLLVIVPLLLGLTCLITCSFSVYVQQIVDFRTTLESSSHVISCSFPD